MSDAVITIRPRTTKAFTVVAECVDPPIPAMVYNTNREDAARRVYKLYADELRNNPGGEASVTLYQHTAESLRKEFWCEEEGVYAVLYEGSMVLEKLDYMDIMGA